ncbi:hypothetical protein BT69DRAFT_1352129 [Atractiella rhizophila]|nr:hypothetical protein BT69DRAFT_1352129 [Atractiella rhizophila]
MDSKPPRPSLSIQSPDLSHFSGMRGGGQEELKVTPHSLMQLPPLPSNFLSERDRKAYFDGLDYGRERTLLHRGLTSVFFLYLSGSLLFRSPSTFPNNTFFFRWLFRLPASHQSLPKTDSPHGAALDRMVKRNMLGRRVLFTLVTVGPLWLADWNWLSRQHGARAATRYQLEHASSPSSLVEATKRLMGADLRHMMEMEDILHKHMVENYELQKHLFGTVPIRIKVGLLELKMRRNARYGRPDDFGEDELGRELYDQLTREGVVDIQIA